MAMIENYKHLVGWHFLSEQPAYTVIDWCRDTWGSEGIDSYPIPSPPKRPSAKWCFRTGIDELIRMNNDFEAGLTFYFKNEQDATLFKLTWL